MTWAFSEKAFEYNLDEDIKEDAKSRKRRIQTELSRALAVLGVKNSTFISMLNSGKYTQGYRATRFKIMAFGFSK